MKRRFFACVVVMALGSCKKQKPLDVQHYPYCGLWGSAAHTLQIWENGTAQFGNGWKTYACIVYITNNILSLRAGRHIDYTINQTPHLDSLSGHFQMMLSGEKFTKN